MRPTNEEVSIAIDIIDKLILKLIRSKNEN